MKTLLLLALTATITISALLVSPAAITDTIPPVSLFDAIHVKKTMKAFSSEEELLRYMRALSEIHRRAEITNKATVYDGASGFNQMAAAAEPSAGKEESVTNTQHARVDEGGIVKVHGDHLVVLRRGRLFTVAIGDGALKPISSVNAFGPDIDPNGTWYDEMLVSADTVVVIGYSYQRGGTEVGLFDINSDGGLAYRSTYHLRSNDYYSSRNYASRRDEQVLGICLKAPRRFCS